MTPDTLRIDMTFAAVGRINRASGTTDKVVRNRLKRMLRELFEAGRLDIVRAIRDGDVTFLQVYDAYVRKALHELPVGDAMPLLSTALEKWIEDARPDYSKKHIINHESALARFTEHDEDARVADLPRVLDELRENYGKKHPRSFNLMRATALSFVRSTLKRSHQLYGAVLAVEERSVPKRKAKAPMTIEAFRGFFPNTDPKTKDGRTDAIAWAMVTTGMHQEEYWGEWHSQKDRVHIAGTKRGGRVRDVPLLMKPAAPTLSRDRFEKNFRERMRATGYTPYDLRRTYAQWMEAAGIPRTRRKLYMGHGVADVTDIYERHEVTAFLVADAKLLGAFLGITPPTDGAKALGVVK